MAGVGDYLNVCSYYAFDYYEIASIYEKQRDGPSRALIDYLPATREQLTVAKFVTVARKVAKRIKNNSHLTYTNFRAQTKLGLKSRKGEYYYAYLRISFLTFLFYLDHSF